MGILSDLRLAEYDESLDNYKKIEIIVADLLEKTLTEGGIHPMQIAHRIKTRDSVAGKLERKSEKYPSVNVMNDLIGFRIICYFIEQVDQMAALVAKVLDVDPKLSSDKRKTMAPTAFGYLSLHYVCRLPKNQGYPEELTSYTFEIQFRTVLQHAWAEIEHDLGYKTEFGIPLDVRREFSRIAGLLEIADESFHEIKFRIRQYVENVRAAIEEDTADNLRLDLNTLTEYLHHSKAMQSFLDELCDLFGAELLEVSPENYLRRLDAIGIKTLGDLNRLLEEEHDHALTLAKETLTAAELDELAGTVGLYFIFRARLVFGGFTKKELVKILEYDYNNDDKVRNQVEGILRLRRLYGTEE